MVGVSLRLTARSTSQKSRPLSKIIAKRPSTPKPLDLMALSFTRVMAICLINFCRMASTGELIVYGGSIENRSRFLASSDGSTGFGVGW